MPDQKDMRPPNPTRSVRADMAERAERAWQARVLGATWEQAAVVADYSNGSNCRRAVTSVYGRLPKVEREDLRRLWRDRLEIVWRQVVKDLHDRVPGSSTAAVRIEQAAAKLDGLDEPSRLELSTPTEREIEAWVGEMLALRQPQLEEADIFADTLDDGA